MEGFAPVSSATRQPTTRLGFGAVAGDDGTLASKFYTQQDAAAGTALVKRDAVLDRPAAGGGWKIPEPGSSSDVPGVPGKRADWLTRAAESVKDRLDLSAAFPPAAWKADTGTVSTLLDVDAGKRSPTAYPTVAARYREALSDSYTRLMRGNTVSPLYSVWA